jgi:hypothetical protein
MNADLFTVTFEHVLLAKTPVHELAELTLETRTYFDRFNREVARKYYCKHSDPATFFRKNLGTILFHDLGRQGRSSTEPSSFLIGLANELL